MDSTQRLHERLRAARDELDRAKFAARLARPEGIRRTLQRTVEAADVAVSDALAALGSWPRPAGGRAEVLQRAEHLNSQAGRVDNQLLDGLETLTTDVIGFYLDGRPADVFDLIRAQVDRLSGLADGSLSPARRTRLVALIADASGFAGNVGPLARSAR